MIRFAITFTLTTEILARTMLRVALLLVALPAALAAIECAPGTYWHTRGSVDCGPAQGCPATGGTLAQCCCACHANYYCPGGKRDQPEDACPAGSTSPPGSTSASDCTGGPPGPSPPPGPSGAFSQIHIAYTGRPNEFSVDFVGGSGATRTLTSMDRTNWTAAPATSFSHPTIGYMSQGLLRFPGAKGQQPTYYMVGDASSNSSVFTVVPNITRPEVFAVYADFGFANDVCLNDLIKSAANGTFDAVLHAGACQWRLTPCPLEPCVAPHPHPHSLSLCSCAR